MRVKRGGRPERQESGEKPVLLSVGKKLVAKRNPSNLVKRVGGKTVKSDTWR